MSEHSTFSVRVENVEQILSASQGEPHVAAVRLFDLYRSLNGPDRDAVVLALIGRVLHDQPARMQLASAKSGRLR